MKYRKKPVVIEATQWFKNGDHPLDAAFEMFDYANGQRPRVIREGAVVRYHRHPYVAGETSCKHCGKIMGDHGWIDTLEGNHIVCPGDWIITGVAGENYPCKSDIFEMTYEAAADTRTSLNLVEIDAIFDSMPDGVHGFCITWGYQQFARAIEDAVLARSVPDIQVKVKHGCHVDLEPGMEPDACVLDKGRPEDCVYARSIKCKEECTYWKPIILTAAPEAL